MNFDIQQSEINTFNKDGALALRKVLDDEWLARIAAAIEEDIQNLGPYYHGYDSDEGLFHGNLRLWENQNAFRDVCLHSHLPKLAQKFFDSKKINLLYDQLFVKESRMSQRTR
jgi:hypothetical protein